MTSSRPPLGLAQVWATLLLVITASPSCSGTGFENSTEVTDLRILAMRLDPPEVELPLDEGADPIPVRVTALIAGPGREPILWQLSTCPSMTSMGCGTTDPDAEVIASPVSSGREESSPPGSAPQAVLSAEHHFPVAELFEMLESIETQGFAGTRPVFELLAASGAEEEVAGKRLQISLPDIAYRLLLNEAGLVTCDSRGLPEGCLDYRTRLPNTNPTIEAVTYRRTSRDGEDAPDESFPDQGPVTVAPGETLHLVPTAVEGSAESHQTLAIDIENRTVRLEDRTEMLIWSWFATGGGFGRSRTEAERTRGELNTWIAPSAPDGDGDVWIWIVLRDNRGGVDFTTLHLRVEG